MIKYIKMTQTAKDLSRGSSGAAGFDICADETCYITPGSHRAVSTGIALEFADGIGCFIRPRSGLAYRHGIDVLAGVIDSDYRGEVRVILINHSKETFQINHGDRIAQLVFQPVLSCVSEWTGTVSETDRGASGFGSTGI